MNIHIKGKKRHDTEFRKKFGIGLYQYQSILEDQNGVCYLCGEKDFRNLAVDHCHENGAVRRLLCTSCNTGLGKFKDNPELLRKAADYVETEFALPEDIKINTKTQQERVRWRLIIHTPDGTFSSAEAASRFYNVGATTIGIWCGVYSYYPSGKKRDGFTFEKVFMTMNQIKEQYNVKD